MTFDPKAYLAEKASQQAPGTQTIQPTAFDPKAYLATKASESGASTPLPQVPAEPQTTAMEAGLQGFGQGGTLGYLPEMQAGTAWGINQLGSLKDKLAKAVGADSLVSEDQKLRDQGFKLPEDESYDDLKNYFQRQDKTMKAEHPTASLAGNVGGAIATIPVGGALMKGTMGAAKFIPGVTRAAELASAAEKTVEASKLAKAGLNVTKAAGQGAGYGFAMNPEVDQNNPNPDAGIDARIENAKTGAMFGAGFGAAGEGLKAGISKYLAMTSGVPKKAIEGFSKHQKEVENLIATEGGADYATKVHGELQDAFFAKKREIGEAIGQAISEGKGKVDSQKMFKPFDDLLTKLRKEKIPAEDLQAIEAEVKTLKDTYLAKPVKTAAPPASQQEAVFQKLGIEKPQMIESTQPLELNAQDAFNFKQIAGNNSSLYNVSGTFRARYPKASTHIDKLWSNANLEAKKIADQEIQRIADTAGLNKQYAEYSRLQDKMERYFSDPDKTFKTLQGIDAPSREFARDTARQIKQHLGIDLQKPAEVLEAYRYFRKPELMPISSGGTTSTSRSVGLSGLGAAAGGAIAGPPGAMIGGAVGAAAHSPAMTKQYIRAGKALQPLAPSAGGLGAASPWVKMKKEKKNGR